MGWKDWSYTKRGGVIGIFLGIIFAVIGFLVFLFLGLIPIKSINMLALPFILLYLIFSNFLNYDYQIVSMIVASIILIIFFSCFCAFMGSIYGKRSKEMRSKILKCLKWVGIIIILIIIVLELIYFFYYPQIVLNNFDFSKYDFATIGNNYSDVPSDLCSKLCNSEHGYSNQVEAKYIICDCFKRKYYIDYSGKMITQKEARERSCNVETSKGLPCFSYGD